MAVIKISDMDRGLFGVSGHVGIGHVHSHSGFVQDDSAGFAVASLLLKKAVPVDTTIEKAWADIENNTVAVITKSGGMGVVSPRRGITPSESGIIKNAAGRNALYTQNIAVEVFGRIYGQGVSEVPVALQGACALSVLDSFRLALKDKMLVTKEKFAGKYDVSAGVVIDVDDTPVSLMLVINGTNGGIGPDEDYEGNTNWTEKGRIMERLGLNDIPTAVIESKAFIPAMAEKLTETGFMVRAQEGVDCMRMGEALYDAGVSLDIPIRFEKKLMPMPQGALAAATAEFADKISAAAAKLRSADSAKDKTEIVAEIAKLISEDAGGVTFMSSSLNDMVRGAGILPGITAVLSMITTKEYSSYWKIPKLEENETEQYIAIIVKAISSLAANERK